ESADSPLFYRRDGTFKLRNSVTDMCIGVAGGSQARGAAVIQWDCHTHDIRDHHWRWQLPAGGVRYQNAATGQCIGIPGGSTTKGEHAIQWTCTDKAPDQVWN